MFLLFSIKSEFKRAKLYFNQCRGKKEIKKDPELSSIRHTITYLRLFGIGVHFLVLRHDFIEMTPIWVQTNLICKQVPKRANNYNYKS